MIKLSLDQETSVEKRLQYMIEANNDKYMEKVSQVFFQFQFEIILAGNTSRENPCHASPFWCYNAALLRSMIFD